MTTVTNLYHAVDRADKFKLRAIVTRPQSRLVTSNVTSLPARALRVLKGSIWVRWTALRFFNYYFPPCAHRSIVSGSARSQLSVSSLFLFLSCSLSHNIKDTTYKRDKFG